MSQLALVVNIDLPFSCRHCSFTGSALSEISYMSSTGSFRFAA